MTQTLTIDIWSDVMCPWCLVGWGNLRKALDTLQGEIEADIRWLRATGNQGRRVVAKGEIPCHEGEHWAGCSWGDAGKESGVAYAATNPRS